jgi:hypothetical protein
MTDPARVIGFLDVFGNWDPALLFVMGGAIGVYGLGMLALRGLGSRIVSLPSGESSPIDRRLVIGATIFGLGWGLGGFCPGPALANLGALRAAALVFVPFMAIGMLLAQRFLGADRQDFRSRFSLSFSLSERDCFRFESAFGSLVPRSQDGGRRRRA